MPDIPTISSTALGALLLMAGAAIGIAAIDRSTDASNLALFLAVAGVLVLASGTICRTIRAVNRPADVAFNDGYEAGFDKGWLEGHAEARPKIVALSSVRDARVADQLS